MEETVRIVLGLVLEISRRKRREILIGIRMAVERRRSRLRELRVPMMLEHLGD